MKKISFEKLKNILLKEDLEIAKYNKYSNFELEEIRDEYKAMKTIRNIINHHTASGFTEIEAYDLILSHLVEEPKP